MGRTHPGFVESHNVIALAGPALEWGDTTPTQTSASYTAIAAGNCAMIGIVHSGTAIVSEVVAITGPCITGATKIGNTAFNTNANGTHKVDIWSAVTTATAGTIGVGFNQAHNGMKVLLQEFTGVDTTQGTNGALGANIVGSWSDSSTTAMAVTLGAFHSAANGVFAESGIVNINEFSAIAGNVASISGSAYNTPATSGRSWFLKTNLTGVAVTAGAQQLWGFIAVELAGRR